MVVTWEAKEADSHRVGSFWIPICRMVTVVVGILVYLMSAKKVLLKYVHTYMYTVTSVYGDNIKLIIISYIYQVNTLYPFIYVIYV